MKDYKPTSIDHIVIGDERARTLLHRIISGEIPFPANGKNGILLHGPVGVGKSALAQLIPHAIHKRRDGYDSINDEPSDYAKTRTFYIPRNEVHTFDVGLVGSDANYLEEMEDGIKRWFYKNYRNKSDGIRRIVLRNHYVIFDDAHLFTQKAFEKVMSIMKCADQGVFIFTAPSILSIKDDSLLDRLHCISMPVAEPSMWLPLAHHVIEDYWLDTISDDALIPVIQECNGSARQIINAVVTLALELDGILPITNNPRPLPKDAPIATKRQIPFQYVMPNNDADYGSAYKAQKRDDENDTQSEGFNIQDRRDLDLHAKERKESLARLRAKANRKFRYGIRT